MGTVETKPLLWLLEHMAGATVVEERPCGCVSRHPGSPHFYTPILQHPDVSPACAPFATVEHLSLGATLLETDGVSRASQAAPSWTSGGREWGPGSLCSACPRPASLSSQVEGEVGAAAGFCWGSVLDTPLHVPLKVWTLLQDRGTPGVWLQQERAACWHLWTAAAVDAESVHTREQLHCTGAAPAGSQGPGQSSSLLSQL